MRRLVRLAPVLALALSGLANSAEAAIETVVVTAERRPEAQLNVPLTVTAISGDTLRAHSITNALQLQTLVPGLTVAGNLGSSDNAVFSIRGQNQPFGGADPGVQTYFAEVPFGAGGAGDFYDLDNVQVLEGPQGTLFGRSTTGGAILFEPKRPTDSFEAWLDAQGGDFQYGRLEGAVNVPIFENVLDLRVAGAIERRNGYTRDVSFGIRTDNIENESVRVGLLFHPDPTFQNYLVYDGRWDRTHGTGNELTAISRNPAQLAEFQNLAVSTFQQQFEAAGDPNFIVDGAAAGTAAFAGYYGALQFALANQQALGPRATTSTIEPRFSRDDWGLTDIAQWDIADHIHLRNIASYRNSEYQPAYDYDGSFLPILEIVNGRTWQTNSSQVTEEIHAFGETADSAWRWIMGFYYENDYRGGYSEIERQAFGGGSNPPLGTTVFQVLNNGGDSKAVFGQVDYDASSFVSGLALTAGARYTWDTKVANESDCAIPPAPACPFPIPAAPGFLQPTQIGHFSAFTWTLAAHYAIDDTTRIYSTVRRGYKSGGFNSGGFGAGFAPEFLTDVEIGVKHAGTLFGIPAAVNADAYYGWYNNIQKNDFTFVGVVPIVVTFNAAKAHIAGVEFSTEFNPVDNLDLSFFYAYTDARYDSFDTLFTGDHKGDPFVYTPRNKLGATVRLTVPVAAAWGQPSIAATVYHQSRVWFSDFADLEPDSSQGGYALVDLRLQWNSLCGSNFDAAVFANNVGNQTYRVGANPLEHLTLTTSSMFGPPRMFGVELRYHLGE